MFKIWKETDLVILQRFLLHIYFLIIIMQLQIPVFGYNKIYKSV